MTYVLALALVLFGVQFAPEPRARVTEPEPRFAIMDDYVRDLLSKDWDAHNAEPVILERAYCLRFQRDFWAGEPAWRVTEIAPADSQDASPSSVGFRCPHAPNVATLHVHPPQSCEPGGFCYKGGSYSWQCEPSDMDRRFLAWRGDKFGLIQCDQHAVVAFFPTPP